MQFSKLRLVGFKSFVEPTDFAILPGLTGIIGPNGCGKSNLVEALRWVMGESSYKSMRGSGMDDVIFAGGGNRPARQTAEVTLTLDNGARAAPAAFNDADVLEVSRRIERERGSTYRVNGREVRARDVQILFADAATGSRSPSLVRQGQIAEIIAAKPQARRRVLEEAAGIAGLHTRRHEAELRLRSAEDNLRRIDDILVEIAGRGEELKRQARQAKRFREIQSEVRRLQAVVALLGWEAAERDIVAAREAGDAAQADFVETGRRQGEAARLQAIAAHALPALRDAETAAGSALQGALVARQVLDGDERRAKNRRSEVERRLAEMTADLQRVDRVAADAAAALARLDGERETLEAVAPDRDGEEALEAELVEIERRRSTADETLAAAQTARAQAEADRKAALARRDNDADAQRRAEHEVTTAEHALSALEVGPAGSSVSSAAAACDEAASAAAAAQENAHHAEQAVHVARERERTTRGPLADAERRLQRLDAEVTTLRKLLAPASKQTWPPVADLLAIEPGLETALVAALDDDLDAPLASDAPTHWAAIAPSVLPALPDGTEALSDWVRAPAALTARLRQIGLVSRANGASLQRHLAVGQRLVSREGDLWRWDGFIRAADAGSAAARRLVERNRLASLVGTLDVLRVEHDAYQVAARQADADRRDAEAREGSARTAVTDTRRALDVARDHHRAIERAAAERDAKRAQASMILATRRDLLVAATQQAAISAAAFASTRDPGTLIDAVATAQAALTQLHSDETRVRSSVQAIARERAARDARLAALAREQADWRMRVAEGASHRGELARRLDELAAEQRRMADAPDRFILARRDLLTRIADAEAALAEARDARTTGEQGQTAADRENRAALDAFGAAREAKAHATALAEAALARLVALRADLDSDPAELPVLAGLHAEEPRPALPDVTALLEAFKADRERLGAVNLRAESELATAEEQRSTLDLEKADLVTAIRRLRQAIGSLNGEGRARLLDAFGRVDGHFRELFTTLFGGGTAELQLVESEDPLEAGLEIVARPPGKKPQVMTLLSGGEQALTAISLIFAVFLTNPSPICVLDEVDAPLDDANVERFCDLVAVMRSKTQTRFLTITHNPITMSRMDRLCGVTQAERGISQIVSVDLAGATELLDAS